MTTVLVPQQCGTESCMAIDFHHQFRKLYGTNFLEDRIACRLQVRRDGLRFQCLHHQLVFFNVDMV